MKKYRLLLVIIFVCMGVLFVTGCEKKQSLTVDDFKSKISELGFTTKDAKDQFADYDYVKNVVLAINSNGEYQIEFYEFSDDEHAVSFFNTNKSIFEQAKGTSSSEKNVIIQNYSKYTLSTNGKYQLISRINNTAIYLNVDKKHSKEVKSILKKLGY